MTRATETKSKIVPAKDLGNPKAVTALPADQTTLAMGIVRGRVEKIITRTMPTGDAFEGLSGFFESEPADVALPIIQSGICYLPAGIFEKVATPLKDAQKSNENAYFDFVISVATVKAANGAGYEWSYTPSYAQIVTDPIAHLRTANPGKQATAKK